MTKKIYIDPGHSYIDPGAVGYEVERDLNEKVSKFMAEHLRAKYVCETKVCPINVDSLTEIANDANNWGADLFVSNHFNAGGGDGFEALVYSEETVPLGQIFAKHVEAIGQNLRLYGAAPGVKIRPGLAVLKRTNMPAVLTEGAFVDNKKDIEDWNGDAELKRLGEAYAEAAAEYLQLEKKISAPAAKPEAEAPRTLYRVQVGAFSKKANAERKRQAVEAAGFEGAFLANVDGNLWRVQVGAFSVKANAVKLQAKLEEAGFTGYVTTLGGTTVATTPQKIAKGSTVRVKKGAKTYTNGGLSGFVYERDHKVSELNGDRAVITYNGVVVAAVHVDDLIIV